MKSANERANSSDKRRERGSLVCSTVKGADKITSKVQKQYTPLLPTGLSTGI